MFPFAFAVIPLTRSGYPAFIRNHPLPPMVDVESPWPPMGSPDFDPYFHPPALGMITLTKDRQFSHRLTCSPCRDQVTLPSSTLICPNRRSRFNPPGQASPTETLPHRVAPGPPPSSPHRPRPPLSAHLLTLSPSPSTSPSHPHPPLHPSTVSSILSPPLHLSPSPPTCP